MKLTIIGYWGGYPVAGGATSGYLLQQDGYNFLIDCGSAVVSNLQRYIDIEDLNAVAVSHYHHDHVADIGPLQYACLIKSRLGQINGILDIYGHPHDEDGFGRLTMESYTRGIPYDENEELKIGPFTMKFIRTKHHVICYAMRIRCGESELVYTADGSFSTELIDFSRGADTLLCECNFYPGQNGSGPGHMNSTDAANIAEKAGVKKLILTHLPQYGNHEELLIDAKKHFKGEVFIAAPQSYEI